MNKKNLHENLFKALGLFIEAVRSYIISKLKQKAGKKWPDLYYQTLNHNQKEEWTLSIKSGIAPENLIDFHNLKFFQLHIKTF